MAFQLSDIAPYIKEADKKFSRPECLLIAFSKEAFDEISDEVSKKLEGGLEFGEFRANKILFSFTHLGYTIHVMFFEGAKGINPQKPWLIFSEIKLPIT